MSEHDYENSELSGSDFNKNNYGSNDIAEEWVAEPGRPQPAAGSAYGRSEGYNGGSYANGDGQAAAGTGADPAPAAQPDPDPAGAEPTEEWVAEPGRPQPAAGSAYGRSEGYNGGSYANGDGQAAAGTGADPAGAVPAARSAAPSAVPATKEQGRRPSLWWPILLVCLSLLAGYFGARLQTKSITAKVTDEITNDIQAYMEEAGATVLYRSVSTQGTGSADTAIDVAAVASLTSDSVVEIATEYISNDIYSWFFSGTNVKQGAGSGVILSEDGYILTCYHVIENANTITVATRQGQTYEAVVVGGDEEEDIAILKVEAQDLTPAVMGSSDQLVVGSPVVAVGNPLGQLGGTVTAGIVSALERQVTIEDQTYNVIQTDAAINRGNSGGGLFNSKGELVGLVNGKAASIGVEGLAFAIPLDNIKDYIEDIVAHGVIVSKVTLGVQLLDATDQRTALSYRLEKPGVYILSVQDNSSAAYAGLQSGDRIVSIDGEEVESGQQVIDLISSKQVGDVLEMVIERGGQEQQLSVTLYGPNQDPANIQQT